ncbi:Molecular chaperones HSP105/HSP110/SSE1, HSP70 superfamily [Handroanthus impetiginosus]|uniref:Molecular chaperones HSP105/HSP110/SSE1, HSP70 superfamily n=1 Tax=Handroanthus impetiginosus TaxID=429701 RepID=A0A2G9HV03_9LAMI|nr:Molecular chaperones HSP105/HSP110/SSE1, HSP70 superfamily [Handroanthus impetiginosus]
MSVVGFDIGNENCVIAVAKQRGIDVLLNDESKRENPAVVSFGEKQRFIGSAGAASATMHPKSTISQVKRLIGRNFNEPAVQDDLRLLPFETSEGPDGGILIHLQYLGEKQTFMPVQILAMLLAHLKQITEKNLEMPISNCVIGIPSYFTALQRRAYLNAAEIAGLKPLRLMHDCAAIGLGYGIYKTDFPNRGPTNVVFVDIGHSDTQVAIVSFEPGHMKVLSHAFDSNLGGRDFDDVLFRHFAAQFKEQYNIDVYSSTRASIRLRAACEKLKKVLSANPEAPLNIECLMEEKDVKGYIKRDEFEKLASALLERISIPCRKALLESGLAVETIHTVELVGSGSRIPAITKMVNSLFRKEPSRTLNASECVARGCAVQCAMLSPIFRVREYEVQDCFPFSIAFASDQGPCSLADGVLFPKGNAFPSTKMLTLHRNDIFPMEAFYANENELPSGVSTRISSFKIGPFRVSHVEKTKIKVKVQLNLNGIVTIESASLIDDHVDDSTVNNSINTQSEKVEASNQESLSKANGSSGHEIRRLKAIRRQDIFIDENAYGGMTQGELSQAQEKELQLAQQDIKMERTKEKKNALEAYVYETRNKLLDTYRSFATNSEKEGISSSLQQTEEWLYEDGDDEAEYVYAEKLEDLKKMVDPIESRYKDEEARALATRNLLNCISEYRMAAGSLPPGERDVFIGECNKAEEWLQEKIQQQDSLPKNADPILWSSEITRKAEALNEMYKHVTGSKSTSPEPEGATRSKRDGMEVD